MTRFLALIAGLALSSPAPLLAGQTSAAAWTALLPNEYRVIPNVTYVTVGRTDVQLDVFVPRNGPGPYPTILLIHGGGWTQSTRWESIPRAMAFIEMGFAVVNTSYRLAAAAPAPAAVEDCQCALRWIARNADKYKFDLSRLAVTGFSSGGHLALTARSSRGTAC